MASEAAVVVGSLVAATLPGMSAFALSMPMSSKNVDMWIHHTVCSQYAHSMLRGSAASCKLGCHGGQLLGRSVEGAAAAAWHPERCSLSDEVRSGHESSHDMSRHFLTYQVRRAAMPNATAVRRRCLTTWAKTSATEATRCTNKMTQSKPPSREWILFLQ